MASVTDDFNRANGNLGANYSDVLGYSGEPQIVSNQLQPAVAQSPFKYRNDITCSGDQYSQIKCIVKPTADRGISPAIKVDPTAGTFYHVHCSASALELRRNDISVGSPTSISYAANDVIKLYNVGSLVKIAINGVDAITFTDTTPLTGTRVGFLNAYGDADARFDDFEAGDYVGSPTGTGAANIPAMQASGTAEREVKSTSAAPSLPAMQASGTGAINGIPSVTLTNPLATAGARLRTIPDLAAGDIVQYEVVGGSGSLTVNPDGSFIAGIGVTHFRFRVDDGGGFGAWSVDEVAPAVIRPATRVTLPRMTASGTGTVT